MADSTDKPLFEDQNGDFSLKVRLPTGGMLVAPTDPTGDVPSDCSRVFGLLPQVASYLASSHCLLKVLELTGPLLDIVKILSGSPELAASALKFLKVAEALVPCLGVSTGLGVLPFVRDVLCLVMQAVNCITPELKAVVSIMTALAIQLNAAQAAGNRELVEKIKGAQKNAQIKATALFASIEEVQAVLELAAAYFNIAGVSAVQLPSAPTATDPNSLTQLLVSLQNSAASLQVATDALEGCSP
jgi:hypothetical protein